MGKKFSVARKADKFQPSIEARDTYMLVGGGKSNEKLEPYNISPGHDRGSDPVNVQFGASRIHVITHRLKPPDPQQHEKDKVSTSSNGSSPRTHAQQESACTTRNNACFMRVSKDEVVSIYPVDADIVTPLLGTCIKSFMLIPEQNNVMIPKPQEDNFDNDGDQQNGILLQDKPIIQCFVKNVEPDVPN